MRCDEYASPIDAGIAQSDRDSYHSDGPDVGWLSGRSPMDALPTVGVGSTRSFAGSASGLLAKSDDDLDWELLEVRTVALDGSFEERVSHRCALLIGQTLQEHREPRG